MKDFCRLLAKVDEFEVDCDEWLVGNQIQMTSPRQGTDVWGNAEHGSQLSSSRKPKRATRALIALITNLPRDLLESISPRTVSL